MGMWAAEREDSRKTACAGPADRGLLLCVCGTKSATAHAGVQGTQSVSSSRSDQHPSRGPYCADQLLTTLNSTLSRETLRLTSCRKQAWSLAASFLRVQICVEFHRKELYLQ